MDILEAICPGGGCSRRRVVTVSRRIVQRCAFDPRIVITHNVFVIQSREQLNFACYFPVQLTIFRIQLYTLYRVYTTVQFVSDFENVAECTLAQPLEYLEFVLNSRTSAQRWKMKVQVGRGLLGLGAVLFLVAVVTRRRYTTVDRCANETVLLQLLG